MTAQAREQWQPYCAPGSTKDPYIIAGYLGADYQWSLSEQQKKELKKSLQHVSVVNYAFVRFGKDKQNNTILSLTNDDINNIQQLRQARPDLPILLSIGGWNAREAFTPFLNDPQKIQLFVDSVFNILNTYQLDGIDVDWENEQLASQKEIKGLVQLFKKLREKANTRGFCVTSAIPATPAYWKNYPNASTWGDYLDWTTIMAYDHYGTFGSETEHAASLYASKSANDRASDYPYPVTSGNLAVQHYVKQGLSAKKILLGLPFYCHSYYVEQASIKKDEQTPGLHTKVLDPNISSQVIYSEAYEKYGDQLFKYRQDLGNKKYNAPTFYGLIDVPDTSVSRFMSCDAPESIKAKVRYVKGVNPLQNQTLRGVSIWNIIQDLPYDHQLSLLKAINETIEENVQ